MAEWFKAPAWKACKGASLSRVRIPSSPPFTINNQLIYKEIENARVQNGSVWNVSIAQMPETVDGRFEIQITRPDESFPPTQVKATFIRTVIEGYDQEVTLSHLGNGLYGAPVKLTLIGQWDVLVVVESQNISIFKLRDWFLVK